MPFPSISRLPGGDDGDWRRVRLEVGTPPVLRPKEQINRDPWPPSAPPRLHAGVQPRGSQFSWSVWLDPAWSPGDTRQSAMDELLDICWHGRIGLTRSVCHHAGSLLARSFCSFSRDWMACATCV